MGEHAVPVVDLYGKMHQGGMDRGVGLAEVNLPGTKVHLELPAAPPFDCLSAEDLLVPFLGALPVRGLDIHMMHGLCSGHRSCSSSWARPHRLTPRLGGCQVAGLRQPFWGLLSRLLREDGLKL